MNIKRSLSTKERTPQESRIISLKLLIKYNVMNMIEEYISVVVMIEVEWIAEGVIW